MSKLIISLGIVLLTQTSFAGLLPSEWYTCTAVGQTAEGQDKTFTGNGIHSVEASDNAMYFCQSSDEVSNCNITSCSYTVVKPRP